MTTDPEAAIYRRLISFAIALESLVRTGAIPMNRVKWEQVRRAASAGIMDRIVPTPQELRSASNAIREYFDRDTPAQSNRHGKER